jgi:hypothetical protein
MVVVVRHVLLTPLDVDVRFAVAIQVVTAGEHDRGREVGRNLE